jgi:hypothetical protein
MVALDGEATMTIDISKLKARWAWTTVLAIAVLAVLAGLDAQIKKASGFGILDLEFVNTAAEVNAITGAWAGADQLAQMGFLMGLDYLYMAAYGFALFYGALAAREAFAREPSARRRILTILAFAPLAGAALDVLENALEAKMLFTTATDPLAGFTYAVTMTKFALIDVGLVLSVAGLVGLFMGRLKRA